MDTTESGAPVGATGLTKLTVVEIDLTAGEPYQSTVDRTLGLMP